MKLLRRIPMILSMLVILSCGGVYAAWQYQPDKVTEESFPVELVMAQPDVPIVINDAARQFEKILNTPTLLTELITEMNKETGNRNETYIGTVEGAPQSDKDKLIDLFEGRLSINIDGQEKNISIIIKRENIDGSTTTGESGTGSEMVMYFTDESLQKTSWGTQRATVYAIVYTKSASNAKWTQIGNIFTGNAPITDYESGSQWGRDNDGSFNTDNWRENDTNRTIEQVVSAALGN